MVLVDDARCLGADDYPAYGELERRLRAVPGIERVEVAADIVRATPRPPA